MAKAIKHIRAGLLHIEIIGSIPEPKERKSRAPKHRATMNTAKSVAPQLVNLDGIILLQWYRSQADRIMGKQFRS